MKGAELLRLHGPRAVRGATILGHQVLLSDILDAPHDVLGLQEPRRSFKTSTLFSKAVGRISSRADYMVAYTMTTTAIKARTRFRDDIVRPLELLFPDPKSRPFKLNKAGGSERVEWLETGSVFAFLAPKGDSFRSDAWDWIILDEAGQAGPDMGADILDGAAATQDTRPGAHMTIAGTGAKYRTGNLLWDELEKGRAGLDGHAILDYSADQTLTEEEVNTWEKARAIIIDVHPLLGSSVTDERAIRKSYDLVGPASFLREYLGVADLTTESGFLDLGKWAAGGLDGDLPTIPDHHRVALAVDPLGRSAALVAAWRDDDGHACFLAIDHKTGAGTGWVKPAARAAYSRLRSPLVHDGATASVQAVVDELRRLRNPALRFEAQTWPQVSAAASLFKSEIDAGNVRHWNDEELTHAVTRTKKRGTTDAKRWALGRIDPETDDITLVEAAALALRAYDDAQPRTARRTPSFVG
ncbi:hypothetical protein [Schumannella soli]|uniref:Terminase n=1 Tax=Schumannella soli TaxID=2590779 RepID=A0A506XT61_9MICO|nr:hypothetical protein [Schumannella soli]TPW75891.1 hypothetical protein FJ657_08570 [Schumannella soli]